MYQSATFLGIYLIFVILVVVLDIKSKNLEEDDDDDLRESILELGELP